MKKFAGGLRILAVRAWLDTLFKPVGRCPVMARFVKRQTVQVIGYWIVCIQNMQGTFAPPPAGKGRENIRCRSRRHRAARSGGLQHLVGQIRGEEITASVVFHVCPKKSPSEASR